MNVLAVYLTLNIATFHAYVNKVGNLTIVSNNKIIKMRNLIFKMETVTLRDSFTLV
jgi:hypothetical protein